jgi:hypothetical protein
MIRSKIFISVLALLLTGCAGLRYPADKQLMSETAAATNGDFGLRVPMGWFNSTDSKAAPGILIWLVKKDYSASLALTEIHTDEIGLKQIKTEGLHAVAEISLSVKKEIAQQEPLLVGNFENFSLDDKDFCSYEYTTDKGYSKERVVVFTLGKKWYELAAVPFSKRGRNIDPDELFSIQNSVLHSISAIPPAK